MVTGYNLTERQVTLSLTCQQADKIEGEFKIQEAGSEVIVFMYEA